MLTNEDGMVHNLEYLLGLSRSDNVVPKFVLVCYVEVKTCPQTTQTNYEQLSEVLKSLNWEELGSLESLKEAYKTFKSHISKVVEECSKWRAVPHNKNIYMNQAAMQLRKKKKKTCHAACVAWPTMPWTMPDSFHALTSSKL